MDRFIIFETYDVHKSRFHIKTVCKMLNIIYMFISECCCMRFNTAFYKSARLNRNRVAFFVSLGDQIGADVIHHSDFETLSNQQIACQAFTKITD